ncbi:MAG: type VI secretion system tip protein VgrG, partial [Desulfobulbaceae bacterium]|nr:type VI secretion system tip protein VgrG [Desulfobulbaceae bacterium]
FDKEYIIINTTHSGTQPQVLQEIADSSESNTYVNTFKTIPGDVNFKPPKLKKPSVRGIQTALVTGPKGEEIHIDEHGRIKAQCHWDRKGKTDENSSCWLRVAQPWAGSGWGTVFIPRIGQEVIVNFIDGDPDRPLVTGALYNGDNKPPYSLPEDKTRSTIKTNTTPGGNGFNELRFEDKKEEEEIYIHGQKDWNIEIKNDKGQHIGHDETMAVDNDRSKKVGNDQKEEIGNNKDIKVTKNHTEDIGENSTHAIGKNSDERVGESKTIDITKNREETIGEKSTINIGKESKYSVGDDSEVSIGKSLTHTTGKELKAD